MELFDYTEQGRRPSARQIVADWKKAGKPPIFQAEYGETFAHFEMEMGKWFGSGNGCEGIKRGQVEDLLNNEREPVQRTS